LSVIGSAARKRTRQRCQLPPIAIEAFFAEMERHDRITIGRNHVRACGNERVVYAPHVFGGLDERKGRPFGLPKRRTAARKFAPHTAIEQDACGHRVGQLRHEQKERRAPKRDEPSIVGTQRCARYIDSSIANWLWLYEAASIRNQAAHRSSFNAAPGTYSTA
jgi:hypothetical protein